MVIASKDRIKMESEKLQDTIKRLSETKQISLNKVSEEIGLSRMYLSNLFSKKALPSLINLFKIAAVLGTDYNELIHDRSLYIPQDEIIDYDQFLKQEYRFKFTHNDWYKHFQELANETKYEIELETNYGTCYINNNTMADAGILRDANVIYEKNNKFEADGLIYCFATKNEKKQVRELYRCNDTTPKGYIAYAASKYGDMKARFIPEDDIKIYGKALYVINKLNVKDQKK
jgi:transcriptional regulator with XRE-family HTH domain